MTSGSSKKKEEVHVANGGLKQSTWSKALSSRAVWDDKDEFLDVVYWIRQIIAIILGVIWGVVPLKGFLGIAIFCLVNAGVLYVYFSSFQQVDEEEYGGTVEHSAVQWGPGTGCTRPALGFTHVTTSAPEPPDPGASWVSALNHFLIGGSFSFQANARPVHCHVS
ncbi:hypothetical protein AMELA_G00192860 [Ameiurus melas]|uniref:RAB5 interacting factor n=1 Tax=Ameiurus melas TaxID=219545 RepID=A0A7J6A4Z8_AMEME|nr:hypothetical protein AMELA_G00192860 [Ameiurus melas]